VKLSRALTAIAFLQLIAASPLAAQRAADPAVLERIRQEGMDRSQVVGMFNQLTNVFGPRLTATPAYKRSAEWTRDRLAQFGLANPHLESWPFGWGWTLEKLTLEMTSPRYFPLIGYPEAWSPPTPGGITGTPVYVGDKTADEIRAMSAKLKGAIVLTQMPQDEFITEDRQQPSASEVRVPIGAPRTIRGESTVNAREMSDLLQAAGAAVRLRASQGQHGTMFVLGSRNTGDDAVPSIIVASEQYNMIVRLLQANEPVTLNVEVGVRYHAADTSGYNIIAEIPGTDPQLRNEVVMAGAHLDSWHSSTGATDNADAVAALLEAARILKATSASPGRTIRFAFWGGEEEGLLGSRAWVDAHLAGDANRAERERTVLYLNDDPGTGPTYGFYLEENEAIKPLFDVWLAPLKGVGARRNVMDKIGSTDHLSFIRVGVPGFTTIKDYQDYDVRTHHTNVDAYERVSAESLKQSAVVLATVLYQASLAKLPARAAASPTGNR
jgi:hypothetical protein